MNKPLEICWKDKSSTRHRFWIYRRGTKFNEPCPGIYIYARETSPHKWVPIYIEQTKNVNVRLTNPEQQECVDQNGATHIHVSIITDEKSRLAIEKDLIQQWKPVCNTQLVGRDKERKPYTVRYGAVNAMLLNEFLKEHRRVEEQGQKLQKQGTIIAKQQKQIEALAAGLHKVSAQVEMNRTAPQLIGNNQ